jgi:hypothetical protein
MEWIQGVQEKAVPEPPKRTTKKREPVARVQPGPALEENDPPELHADDEAPQPLETLDVQEDAPECPAAGWPMDDRPGVGGDDFEFDDAGDDQIEPVFPGVNHCSVVHCVEKLHFSVPINSCSTVTLNFGHVVLCQISVGKTK